MITEDNRSRTPALFATLALHGLIIGVLLFLTLKPPFPLPKEVSVEVAMADLGTTLDGQGNVTPEELAQFSTNVKSQNDFNAQPLSQSEDTPDQVVTNDRSDVEVNSTDKKVDKPKDTDVAKSDEQKPVERKINARALYSGNKGAQNGSENGGSEGSGTGIGDRGSADGTPGGKGILGNGSGTWELNGRSMVREYRIPTTQEQGVVVVKIWVDKRGTVFRAKAGLEGSNTTSEYLFNLAEEAALRYKFNPKEEAPPEQVGKMTFIFILK